MSKQYWVKKTELNNYPVWEVMDGDEWTGTFKNEADALHEVDVLNFAAEKGGG